MRQDGNVTKLMTRTVAGGCSAAGRVARSMVSRAPQVAGLLLAVGLSGCTLDILRLYDLYAVRARFHDTVKTAASLARESDQGLAELSDWQGLPHLRNDRYEQFSSHHRRPGTLLLEPGGRDFDNFIALSGWSLPTLMGQVDRADVDGGTLGGYLLASVDDGPGFVTRMFFTRFRLDNLLAGDRFFDLPDLGGFDYEVLRIYVDDLSRPAMEVPLTDLGEDDPFARPLAGRTVAATVSYTPISFRHRLRVVLGRTNTFCAYFYHVDVKRIDSATRPFSPRLADDPAYGASAAMLGQAGDAREASPGEVDWEQNTEVPAGAEAVAFSDASGGTLTRLGVQCDDAMAARLAGADLRVFYDESERPAFDVPLDAFCGAREQLAPLRTLALRVDRAEGGLSTEMYLPMPYRRSVRIVVRNRGDVPISLKISGRVDRALPAEPWGYLHARSFAVAGPQPEGSRFEVVSVSGRGRHVGTFLFAAGDGDRRMGPFRTSLNILEGNEEGIIDGVAKIFGTGTEDYFNAGFYFGAGPFDSPFAAANYVKGGFSNEPGVVSCCRWHVLSDAIDFQESFALRFQYGVDNPAMVRRYATVAYYYLDRPDPGAVTGGNVIVDQ